MVFDKKLAFFGYSPATLLKVSGEDAETFLQGQFTNDIRSISRGGSLYGLWLDQKGKVVADSFIVRTGSKNEFWAVSYFTAAAVIRERLEAYVIADDVVIEGVTPAWGAIALVGEGALTWLVQNKGQGFSFSGRRIHGESREWVLPAGDIPAAREHLISAGANELPAGEMEQLRIGAGIAAVPKDIGPGELPNEGGLEAEAISYTKGCYLGQEVMARLKSMGRVRRRLLRVRGVGEPPVVLPAALFAGVRKVGELRSAAHATKGGFAGLALLSLLHVEAGSKLAFSPDGEPTVSLIDPP